MLDRYQRACIVEIGIEFTGIVAGQRRVFVRQVHTVLCPTVCGQVGRIVVIISRKRLGG
ncbi:hypothetical protein D3C86_1723850 [compost metagenome]